MRTVAGSAFVLYASVCTALMGTAQTRAPTASTGVPGAGAGGAQQPPSAGQPAPSQPSAEFELVFWQSIVNSTDPADFEAYLRRFPNGVFVELAQNRLSALGASGGASPVFRRGETCAGQVAGTACWKEISGRPGCYVWDPGLVLGQAVTWTGECSSGLAQGTGSLTWVFPDGEEMVDTGRLQDGKMNGHWVFREPDGTIGQGPMVAGEQNGDWSIRRPNGDTSILRYENGVVVEIR